MSDIQTELKQRLYELTDSFLVEAKDQNGKERSIERLNADRHIFVENILEMLSSHDKEVEKKASYERELKHRRVEAVIKNKHAYHKKHCVQQQWGKNIGHVISNGIVVKEWLGDVDLWYCQDCDVNFIHDWHEQSYSDIKLPQKNGVVNEELSQGK